MTALNSLTNPSRPAKTRKRVGRGIGSGVGKTCGRGEKGAGARSGYKRRFGYEGGQFRTFMKMPQRGFSNAAFRQALHSVNLGELNAFFEDGDVVNVETLAEHGFIRGRTYGVKILGYGELKKKVTFDVEAISEGALEKLDKAHIKYTIR